MRKLIVSMNVTLDGFISGPECELDWHFDRWDEEMAITATEQLSQADTILLGRVTYSAMARYWSSKGSNCYVPRVDIDFADMINRYEKIVFSHSMKSTEWNNSKIINDTPEVVLPCLKEKSGKNIILYGSGKLIACLMLLNVVDEYQLWMHPVMLGKGKRLFTDIAKMRLYKTQVFKSGVVFLVYKPMCT